MKSKVLPFIILILLVASIPFLVIAVRNGLIFSPKASSATPQFITVSNVSDSTATISWVTTEKTPTQFSWGNSTSLGSTEVDSLDKIEKVSSDRTVHTVTLSSLAPDTTYYYRITSADTQYPAAKSTPLSFVTYKKSSEIAPAINTIFGEISDTNESVIVLAISSDFQPLQTISSNDGTWYIDLSKAKNISGKAVPTSKETEVTIIAYNNSKATSGKYSAKNSPITLSLNNTLSAKFINESKNITTPKPTTTTTPTNTGGIPLKPLTSKTPTVIPLNGPANVKNPTRNEIIDSMITPTVSNITDSSISISYLSYEKVADSISYGLNANSMNSTKLDDLDSTLATPRYLHHYTINGLTANSQYFLRATSENVLRTFKLPARISYPSGKTILTGTLKNTSGECFVRTQIGRGSTVSSLITTLPVGNSAWSVNIAPVRTSNLESFMIPIASDLIANTAYCINSNGAVQYATFTTTVHEAVTSGVNLSMIDVN